MQSSQAESCDVAIVGYGPVGAVLANLLGRDGLRVVAFEREREVYRLPRAVHFDHEVMRIFQSIGLSEVDLPQTAPIRGYEFINGARELLFRFDMDLEVTGEGWNPDYMFHQPSLEACLRDAAAKRESVQVHLEHEVTRVEERENDVLLSVRDVATGESRIWQARYVVGCDGANSFVRRQAGLRLDDLEFDEPWLVVDATVRRPPGELGLPHCPLQLCDPARPVTFVPVAGPYIRWEFMLLPGEGKQDMLLPERIHSLIAEWVDPGEVEVIRSAVYDFHALVAERWNTQRVFLAGDAAHQTPPFLGQGLCTGIRDAANLAWKLEAVLRGAVSESILATYQTEREPQVRAVIELAVAMGRIICTQDRQAAAKRDADFLGRPSRELSVPPFPGLGNGFFLSGAPLAGARGLQARVRAEDGEIVRLDELVGSGFALLVRGAAVPALAVGAQAVLERFAVRILATGGSFDADGAYAAWFDEHSCDAVLIRPDRAVFGGAAGPAAASSLLLALAAAA
jgi:3-(3-hydroxy-phenyl)propionate hydroxylase